MKKAQVLWIVNDITQKETIMPNTKISLQINDDVIIPFLGSDCPDYIQLRRYVNHMPMFTIQVSLNELKTHQNGKKCMKRKLQTKSGEILIFTITLLNHTELRFANEPSQSILEHYLLLENLHMKDEETVAGRRDSKPSYFVIKCSNQIEYVMPLHHGSLYLKLPNRIKFEFIRNGKGVAESEVYSSQELPSGGICMQMQGKTVGSLAMKMKWGINLHEAKADDALLLSAHQIMIYDMQVKFESPRQHEKSKIKIVYGTKSFEIGSQVKTTKNATINKIVCFMLKSEDEEINVIVENEQKVVGQSRIYSEEIIPFVINHPKRKILEPNSGKLIGNIKFRCTTAKNLSLPHNNKFWREAVRKRLAAPVLLQFSQLSVNYMQPEPTSISIKSDKDEIQLLNLPNFQYYDPLCSEQTWSGGPRHQPATLTARKNSSISLLVRELGAADLNGQSDSIGIALLNPNDLKMGLNIVEIPFYKNHIQTVAVNCMINKVTSHPFIKSVCQPEIINTAQGNRSLNVGVFMKKVAFTPYFYTYCIYQNKGEVYGVVEVDRVKKVLIMQNSAHDDLLFSPSIGSDTLNFTVDHSSFATVKIIFIVSDTMQQEQIYGSAVLKIKINELYSQTRPGNTLAYEDIQINNQYGLQIGCLSLQLHQSLLSTSHRNQSQDVLDSHCTDSHQQVHNRIYDRAIANRSVQGKHDNQCHGNRLNNHRKHLQQSVERDQKIAGSLKLPLIQNGMSGRKQTKETSDFGNALSFRRRGTNGVYEEVGSISMQSKQEIKKRRNGSLYSSIGQYTQQNNQHGRYTNPRTKVPPNPTLQKNLEQHYSSQTERKQHLQEQIEDCKRKLEELKNELGDITQNEDQRQSDQQEEHSHGDEAERELAVRAHLKRDQFKREPLIWGNSHGEGAQGKPVVQEPQRREKSNKIPIRHSNNLDEQMEFGYGENNSMSSEEMAAEWEGNQFMSPLHVKMKG